MSLPPEHLETLSFLNNHKANLHKYAPPYEAVVAGHIKLSCKLLLQILMNKILLCSLSLASEFYLNKCVNSLPTESGLSICHPAGFGHINHTVNYGGGCLDYQNWLQVKRA